MPSYKDDEHDGTSFGGALGDELVGKDDLAYDLWLPALEKSDTSRINKRTLQDRVYQHNRWMAPTRLWEVEGSFIFSADSTGIDAGELPDPRRNYFIMDELTETLERTPPSAPVPADQGNVSTFLQSRIHESFTRAADQLYGMGLLNTDDRIAISGAIGDALSFFVKALEKSVPDASEMEVPTEIAQEILRNALKVSSPLTRVRMITSMLHTSWAPRRGPNARPLNPDVCPPSIQQEHWDERERRRKDREERLGPGATPYHPDICPPEIQQEHLEERERRRNERWDRRVNRPRRRVRPAASAPRRGPNATPRSPDVCPPSTQQEHLDERERRRKDREERLGPGTPPGNPEVCPPEIQQEHLEERERRRNERIDRRVNRPRRNVTQRRQQVLNGLASRFIGKRASGFLYEAEVPQPDPDTGLSQDYGDPSGVYAIIPMLDDPELLDEFLPMIKEYAEDGSMFVPYTTAYPPEEYSYTPGAAEKLLDQLVLQLKDAVLAEDVDRVSSLSYEILSVFKPSAISTSVEGNKQVAGLLYEAEVPQINPETGLSCDFVNADPAAILGIAPLVGSPRFDKFWQIIQRGVQDEGLQCYTERYPPETFDYEPGEAEAALDELSHSLEAAVLDNNPELAIDLSNQIMQTVYGATTAAKVSDYMVSQGAKIYGTYFAPTLGDYLNTVSQSGLWPIEGERLWVTPDPTFASAKAREIALAWGGVPAIVEIVNDLQGEMSELDGQPIIYLEGSVGPDQILKIIPG